MIWTIKKQAREGLATDAKLQEAQRELKSFKVKYEDIAQDNKKLK